MQTPNQKLQLSKIGTTVVIIVIASIGGVLGKVLIQDVFSTNSGNNAKEIMEQAEADTNHQLPTMVSDGLRLDRASYQHELGRENVHYYYTFINRSIDEIKELDSLSKQNVRNNVCNSTELENFRNIEVIMHYHYYDKNGVIVDSFFIDTEKC
jgi:hypothetical protein